MKQGKSIQDLAAELNRQQNAKRDFIADTRRIKPTITDGEISLELNDTGSFPVRDHCHQQLCSSVGIPKKYYDRMLTEAPNLLVQNLGYWFENQPAKNMVRTIDGNARAFLSDKYRVLDNYDLAEAVLPVLSSLPDVKVISSEITESKMYIKVLNEKITSHIKVNDIVQAGLVISNSEIGLGSVRIEPLVYRLVCSNGMISADNAMRKYHVGRKDGEDSNIWEVLRDETKKLSDRAFWNKVKDLTKAAIEEAGLFNSIVEKMRQATEREINPQEPERVVEVVAKEHNLLESEGKGIIRHLLSGGDLSQFGLVNAVTRYSQDVSDYDKATEIERLGGRILELSNSEWRTLNVNASV